MKLLLQAVSFYNLGMRSLLVVLWLVLMPLQLSWAAMGDYCLHERGSAASHLGHHAHEHLNQSDVSGTASQTPSNLGDADCGTCHAGCAFAALDAQIGWVVPSSGIWVAGNSAQPSSIPFDLPERPNWSA